MRQKYIWILLWAAMAVTAWAQEKKDRPQPFFTREQAPHLEIVLPNPPELTDALFFNDWAQYRHGISVRDTERGELAVRDASFNAASLLRRFSPAVGLELTKETHPEFWLLFGRLHMTEQQAGASAKAHFKRVRPYQQYKEPSGVPGHERATDFTSYPSGHTHAAWLVGLALASIDPEHTAEIMKIAYDIGQSRVIVGFHYQSDVDMGRLAGSITFARVCAEPEFQEQLQKARKEYFKYKNSH